MATFTFITKSGKTAILTIDGATVSDSCHLAAEPITTEVDDDDDFFAPVRTQSGNINIIGSVSDLENIIGENPNDRPVTLTIDNNVVWKGYLQSSSYSQDWTVGPNEISIPIVSPLVLAESMDIDTSDRGWTSFNGFLNELNTALGSPYSSIVVPSRNSSYIYIRFNRLNYMEYDDEEQTWEGKSYKEVLEDICKFFGWQCQEFGDTLYFLAADCITSNPVNLTLSGNDHEIEYMPGKKSVAVSSNFDDIDDDIVKFNVDDLAIKTFSYITKKISNVNYHYADKLYTHGSVFVTPEDVNPKYMDFYHSITSTTGVGICEERLITLDDGDSSYIKRLVWKLDSGNQICMIYPGSFESFDDAEYFVLSLSCSQADDAKGNYESCDDGNSPFSICMKAGDYYFDFNSATWQSTKVYGRLTMKSGKIQTTQAKDVGFGGYAIPFKSGTIEIELVASDKDHYYALENFSIKRALTWTTGDMDKDIPIEKSYTIGNGFQDEYSIESTLACRKQKHQRSYAFVYDSDNVKYPITISTTGKRPEVDLADRLQLYFSKTRKKITATVESIGSALNPSSLYSASTMSGYVCLAQSVNWRDEEVKGTFFEIP